MTCSDCKPVAIGELVYMANLEWRSIMPSIITAVTRHGREDTSGIDIVEYILSGRPICLHI